MQEADGGEGGSGDAGGGSGLDNSDDAGGSGKGGEGNPQGVNIGEGGEKSEIAERPEYLGEAFWDAEKGQPRLEAMSKSLTDTKAALTKARQSDNKDKPLDTSELYIEGLKLDLTDELKEQLGPIDTATDPMIADWASIAQKEGIGPEKFGRMVSQAMSLMAPRVAEFDEPSIDTEAEQAKLGGPEAAKAITDTLDVWSKSAMLGLSDEEQQRMKEWGKDATGVNLLRTLRAATGEMPIPVNMMRGDTGMSPEELSVRVNDPQNGTSQAFRDETDLLVSKHSGTGHSLGGRVRLA